MKKNTSWFICPTVAYAMLFSACGDDPQPFSRLNAEINSCATEETPVEECNRPLELGDVPITLPFSVSFYLLNTGDAMLAVSAIAGEEVSHMMELPLRIAPGERAPVSIDITPKNLGEGVITVQIQNDDPNKNPFGVELRFNGIPKPVPKIELCLDDTCGPEISVPFGMVRRSQQDSRTLTVKNVGTAPLEIQMVSLGTSPTSSGEIEVLTSTRSGTLDPGTSAPVVVVYHPKDGAEDSVELVFSSNDPNNPEAIATVSGTSDANGPPTADASEYQTGETSLDLFVEDLVVLDGSASSDPEGEPLRFEWTLNGPNGSTATIDDPSAGIVTFQPDVAGTYDVELTVYDSLDQASLPPATITVVARSRFGFRAVVEWANGGDLDLHLVDSGGALFSAADCYFDNPSPDFGVAQDPNDDPTLRDDATMSPGREEIVIPVPADGLYRVYVHYFDERASGTASATAKIIFDDTGMPAFQATQDLTVECATWHVGDVLYPGGTFTPSGSVSQTCP